MTTTLAAPASWRAICPNPPASALAPAAAVLSIEGMPARARWGVEQLLRCLPPAPVVEPLSGAVGDVDDLDATWFTRWRRTPAGYSCREVLHAPQAELRALERRLALFAREHGFAACLSYCSETT